MKYLKNIQSFEDLKEQFKKLAKANHPDMGGDAEIMKEINCEYDALFPIWKNRYNTNVKTDKQSTETADSTRRNFYTENGWEGSNHNWNRSLKEIAVIVRNYVKEKYPTFKFSVRTSYASMCQELHILVLK
jgi:DnaJ-class molecular chaperone